MGVKLKKFVFGETEMFEKQSLIIVESFLDRFFCHMSHLNHFFFHKFQVTSTTRPRCSVSLAACSIADFVVGGGGAKEVASDVAKLRVRLPRRLASQESQDHADGDADAPAAPTPASVPTTRVTPAGVDWTSFANQVSIWPETNSFLTHSLK